MGLAPALLGLASAALWSWWAPFRLRWERLFTGDARAVIWPDMVDMIRSRPLLGHGPGMFEEAAAAYRIRYHDLRAALNHAHNEALQVAADHGLTGLAVALACLLLLSISGVRALRSRPVRGHYLLTAGWLACLAQTYVHAMFDFSLRVFAINQAFMFLSILCVTPVKTGDSEHARGAAAGAHDRLPGCAGMRGGGRGHLVGRGPATAGGGPAAHPPLQSAARGGDHAEGHEDRFPQPIFPDGTGQSRGGPGRRGGR
ncbi:MAG: O-antigen ligase family protein [Kiritimatiellia bacterium]